MRLKQKFKKRKRKTKFAEKNRCWLTGWCFVLFWICIFLFIVFGSIRYGHSTHTESINFSNMFKYIKSIFPKIVANINLWYVFVYEVSKMKSFARLMNWLWMLIQMCKRTLNWYNECHWLNAKSPFQQVAPFKWYNVGKRGLDLFISHLKWYERYHVRRCCYLFRWYVITIYIIYIFDYCLHWRNWSNKRF